MILSSLPRILTLLLEQHVDGAGGVVRLAIQGQLPDGGLVDTDAGPLTAEAELGAGDRNGGWRSVTQTHQ